MNKLYDEKQVFGEIELPLPTADEIAFEASMDFSNQVVAHCSEKGMSFVELAAKLGIKPSTLSEKLNGQNLTLKSMAAMALALDCRFEAPRLVDEREDSSSLRFYTISMDQPQTNVVSWSTQAKAHAFSTRFSNLVAETVKNYNIKKEGVA